MSVTPQSAADREAVDLSALSNDELAKMWVKNIKQPGEQVILDEVNRRYWAEQEMRAAGSGPLRLFPPWRSLGLRSEEFTGCGVQPFA